MGQPVAGNPTQFMMERAFADCELDWRYLTLEVPAENLRDAMAGFRAMGLRGGNFTIPHKVEVIQYLDNLSEAAERMGAVNCVNVVDGKLIGENTDGKGFVQSLKTLVEPAGQKVVIIGAGGAARAISVELALNGVTDITIANRTESRGQELVDVLNSIEGVTAILDVLDGDYEVDDDVNVVINATCIGLGDADARVPLDIETLSSNMVVADVVFNPPMTRLLRDAKQRECQILDGLGMLVNQAVIGFKIWTGVDPRPEVMREALEEYLEI
ncbi:MAG: shikimate dehydrogenase [Planctomycetaceae bacterium]|nr:shikimate dehydrogenase [Planctomycetaceae bacterium]|tara:strand:- start:506 stop:1318 length:813 start_codon:yes stop_codon:yes gene_type:complete